VAGKESANKQSANELTFEAALAELEAIVRELEAGQGDLDKAITDYERGTKLREHCMKKLEGARLKVEKIIQTQQGELATQPFDAAESS